MNKFEMATMPKICKDCKFCVPAKDWTPKTWFYWIPIIGWIGYFIDRQFWDNQWQFAKCSKGVYELPERRDILTGKIIPKTSDMNYCSTERIYGSCGPDGTEFEPKDDLA